MPLHGAIPLPDNTSQKPRQEKKNTSAMDKEKNIAKMQELWVGQAMAREGDTDQERLIEGWLLHG